MSQSLSNVTSIPATARTRPAPTRDADLTQLHELDPDIDGCRVLRGWAIGGLVGTGCWALIGLALWSWLS
jgi:hypothetical protein